MAVSMPASSSSEYLVLDASRVITVGHAKIGLAMMTVLAIKALATILESAITCNENAELIVSVRAWCFDEDLRRCWIPVAI